MIKGTIFTILGIFLFIGCSAQSSPTGSIQLTGIIPTPVRATATMPALPTATQTATLIPATPTNTPVPPTRTPDTLSEAHLKFRNLKIMPTLPDGANLSGTFVLVSPFDFWHDTKGVYKKNQVILWNVETGEKRQLLAEGEYFRWSAVSPDRQWLAYTKIKPKNGVETRTSEVVNASGDTRASIPSKEGWGGFSTWLDDQRIIIMRVREVPTWMISTALLVLNPFTGEQQELPPVPADIYTLSVNPIWWEMGEVSYDPSLTRRVYPSEKNEIVLVDLLTYQTLVRFPTNITSSTPRWSPDGQQFIFASDENFEIKYELYSITKDGQVKRLTYLTSYFQNTYIGSYTWSPDGRKIVFWLKTDQQSWGGELAILDTVTQEVTIYNVESRLNFASPHLPVWSPDGRQLLISIITENGEYIMVVDPVDGWAAQVAEDMAPMGWMVNKK